MADTNLIESIAPLVSAVATLASVFVVWKANGIANTAKNYQKNSLLNKREIELLGIILEKLSIYDAWCKQGASGENVNYHESNEVAYQSRDDAWSQIPRDVKFLLIQLSSHSEKLEKQLKEWESGFLVKMGSAYSFKEELIIERISSLREIRCGGL
ncbi:hypothetical protein [Vibrio breoganii]|uniref:hypothetical protein n=1 Tax=Vibrio breoganii TaxID=553239 RepID=UPI000C8534D7|nr:hypothetical protein [Vibrio breoganii]PMN67145.1 hypothetical protein BCT28_04095 [Vibrio breoganii]